MSIKIYWGANGSYKSASAVEYDIVPELKKGRVVVTNVRGCTLEKVMAQYPEIPDTADIIYIDSQKAGSFTKLRTWFRWAPHGALIVIDEVQLVHKKSWREKDLAEFILRVKDNGQERLATEEEAEQLNQPYDMLDAFTRHRHFNWDIVFTTPNIKYIRDDIRSTSEAAYRQANGALLGSLTAGKFKRSMHDPDRNTPTTGGIVQTLKIDQKTFKCYDSTSTGKVQDTRAGTNLFKSPQLLLALACSLGAFAYSFGSGGFDSFGSQQSVSTVVNSASPAAVQNVSTDSQNPSVSGDVSTTAIVSNVSTVHVDKAADDLMYSEPFEGFDLSLSFHYESGFNRNEFAVYQVGIANESGYYYFDTNQLISMGYKIELLSECMLRLRWSNSVRYVTCLNEYYEEEPEQEQEQIQPENNYPVEVTT